MLHPKRFLPFTADRRRYASGDCLSCSGVVAAAIMRNFRVSVVEMAKWRAKADEDGHYCIAAAP